MYAFSEVKKVSSGFFDSCAFRAPGLVCRLVQFCAAVILAIPGTVAFAQDFRIENELTLGKNEKPVCSLTIFHGDAIYDFIEPNGEIIILDEKNDRFLFVNRRLRIASQLVASECRKTVEKMCENAPKPHDFETFLLNPSFSVSADRDSGEMLFTSRWIEYKTETKSLEDAKIAKRYYRFSDWFCYLNISIHPGAGTQIARLEVNKELQKTGRFPEKLTVTTYPKGNSGMFPSTESVRCRSILSVRLQENDLGRIAGANESFRTFRNVSFEDYQMEILRDSKLQDK